MEQEVQQRANQMISAHKKALDKEMENYKKETELKIRLKYEKCIEYYAKQDANAAIDKYNKHMKEKRLVGNDKKAGFPQSKGNKYYNEYGS